MLRCKDSWWGKKASRFKEETIGMLVRKKKEKESIEMQIQ